MDCEKGLITCEEKLQKKRDKTWLGVLVTILVVILVLLGGEIIYTKVVNVLKMITLVANIISIIISIAECYRVD